MAVEKASHIVSAIARISGMTEALDSDWQFCCKITFNGLINELCGQMTQHYQMMTSSCRGWVWSDQAINSTKSHLEMYFATIAPHVLFICLKYMYPKGKWALFNICFDFNDGWNYLKCNVIQVAHTDQSTTNYRPTLQFLSALKRLLAFLLRTSSFRIWRHYHSLYECVGWNEWDSRERFENVDFFSFFILI